MRASTIVLTCLSVAGAATSLGLGLRLHSELGKIDALNAELQTERNHIRSLPVQSDVAPQSPIAPPPQAGGKMACPKCSAQVPLGKFCQECGGPLAVAPPKRFCTGCGTELGSAKFCSNCGTAVTSP